MSLSLICTVSFLSALFIVTQSEPDNEVDTIVKWLAKLPHLPMRRQRKEDRLESIPSIPPSDPFNDPNMVPTKYPPFSPVGQPTKRPTSSPIVQQTSKRDIAYLAMYPNFERMPKKSRATSLAYPERNEYVVDELRIYEE